MRKILICLFTIGFTVSIAVAQEEVNRSLKVSKDGSVEVSNISGSVTVTGWNKDEVEVTGTLGKGVKELEFETSGDRTKILVILPRNTKNVGETHLEIRVPKPSQVEIETVSATIDVSDVKGALDLHSVSGSITTTGKPREVEVQSVSGNVEIDVDSPIVEVESVSGSVTMKGVSERVKAANVSGDIEVVTDSIERAEFETVSGSISFTGDLSPDGRLEAQSFSGIVELVLPASISAEFDISTFSGGIDNDFGYKPEKSSFSVAKNLSFSMGSGDGRISVETFSGKVRIKQQ
ncbi:DUF4097 domain-containing protein [Acidobacteriota bacterium]